MRQQTFKMPCDLIDDMRLSYTARRVAATLYAHRNALGCCHKSYEQLAQLSGLSPATVRKAVRELSESGYVTSRKTYRYSKRLEKTVYGKTEYHCDLSFKHGFTLVPREVLRFDKSELSDSAFSILLYVLRCMPTKGAEAGRAYPSISKIAELTGAARSTVCLALHALKKLPVLIVQLCRKLNGAFAKSSYYLCRVCRVLHAAEEVEAVVAELYERSFSERVRHWFRAGIRQLCERARRAIFFDGRGSPKFSKQC